MMNPLWKIRVRDCFEAAVDTYDAAAGVQAEIARDLADRTLDWAKLPAGAFGVDIGCGTGALSQAVLSRRPDLRWLATDLSERMTVSTRARLAAWSQALFCVMDGEGPGVRSGTADLICSSLAAQWFVDLPGSLMRLRALLRSGGGLAVATLGEGTFREWKAACAACGFESAMPSYPSVEALRRALGPDAVIVRRSWPLALESGYAFLDHLRRLGAQTPQEGHIPLSVGALRRVLHSLGESPFITAYDVLTILWKKGG